jgi:hypothetical protein
MTGTLILLGFLPAVAIFPLLSPKFSLGFNLWLSSM